MSKNFIVCIALLSLVGCQSVDQKAQTKAIPDVSGKNSFELSWSVDHENEVLVVILKNVSSSKASIYAVTDHLEADIVVAGNQRMMYYERWYFILMTTSVWSIPKQWLDPGQQITWTIKFTDLVPRPYNGVPFATAIESGAVTIEGFFDRWKE